MNIDLEIGLSAINSYKRLAYTAWHAIAELVDNATQSFFDNEAVLRSIAPAGNRPLVVEIEYSRNNDYLKVSDNALGMSLAELRNAMRVANPPSNTTGRSKYGMGLKTAAGWIGNLWIIRTKKLGETVEYTVTVDVEKIVSGTSELVVTDRVGCPPEEHYTIIEIKKMNRVFQTKSITKISDFLSSMYREDFRRNILTLIWQSQILKWDELDKGLLRARDGSVYKRPFEFDILTQEGVSKHVRGWVGVLAEGSRSMAGFSILHSGRVIKGWPDAWRPESLYGQPLGTNDLVNQRLVGEIHLDAFDVSHTKDDILWLGDEEDMVQAKLREHCGEYRDVANSYRKKGQDARGPSEVNVRAAVDRFQRELESPEMTDLVVTNPMLTDALVEQVVEAVTASVVGKSLETFSARIDDLWIKGYIEDMSITDPYLTVESAKPGQIIIIVNSAHPHWNLLKGADGVLNYLRHCTYDGIAEAKARDKKSRSVLINPNTVKLIKDSFLRIPFEIEQNNGEDLSSYIEEEE